MIGWGASWVTVKVLGRYINEYEMILFRFGFTAITMIPIIIKMKHSFAIDMKNSVLVFVTSLVFIGYMKYFFLGTKLGTASLGGAFVTTLIPIITFILLALMGKRSITTKEIIALFIGGVGVMTILGVWNSSMQELLVRYNLYFIIAAFLWAVLTILSSKSTISMIVFTFYMYIATVVIDVLFFVDISSIHWGSFDWLFWLNIGIITLFSTTFANTVYFWGIEKLGAGEVSSFVFLVPFSAIGLSVLFLGEKADIYMIIGTMMTIYAVKNLNNIKFWWQKSR